MFAAPSEHRLTICHYKLTELCGKCPRPPNILSINALQPCSRLLWSGPLVCVIFTAGITHSTVLQSWQVCDKNVLEGSAALSSESKRRPFPGKALDVGFCSFLSLPCFLFRAYLIWTDRGIEMTLGAEQNLWNWRVSGPKPSGRDKSPEAEYNSTLYLETFFPLQCLF